MKEKQELYATGMWIEQIIENQNRNKCKEIGRKCKVIVCAELSLEI